MTTNLFNSITIFLKSSPQIEEASVELGGIPIQEEADVKAFRLPDGNVHLAYYPDGFPDDETFEQHMRDNYPQFYN